MFETISNTDANFLNLHIDKATKTSGDKTTLFNHTFYETKFKPKLLTSNECNGTVVKKPKIEKAILFVKLSSPSNGGDLVFWFTTFLYTSDLKWH